MMKKKPLVSIITVVFNGEKYLEQTIQSVINQSYTPIEYIIIDGGSTDGSIGIIKKYSKYIHTWISEPDKGLYDAMNKGIGLATGDLIGMINSDDWYEENTVEIVVNAFLHNPGKHIFHADRYDISDGKGKVLRKFNPSVFKLKYYGMTYNHPTMFITPQEYKNHKYNPNLKSLSDYLFVLEAIQDNPDKFFYIPQPFVNYRLGGISAINPRSESAKEAFFVRKSVGFNWFQRNLSYVFVKMVTIAFRLKNKFLF